MKNINITLVALSLFFTNCASLDRNPYLRSSSAIITDMVLNEAVSKEDRVNKARIVVSVAELLKVLTESGDMSLENVIAQIENLLPDKRHWREFASAIILVYTDYNTQAMELPENEKIRMQKAVLNKIADGCLISAKKYISND